MVTIKTRLAIFVVSIDTGIDYELTAILRVVFQPLVWSDRSHDVINRHSSMDRWVRLLGLYPSEIHICKKLALKLHVNT